MIAIRTYVLFIVLWVVGLHNSAQERYVSTVWTVLERFGHAGLREELAGEKIHRIDNVMTLEVSAHEFRNNMDLWFEEVEGRVGRVKAVCDPADVFPNSQTSIVSGLLLVSGRYFLQASRERCSSSHTATFHCPTPSSSAFTRRVFKLHTCRALRNTSMICIVDWTNSLCCRQMAVPPTSSTRRLQVIQAC